MQCVLHSCCMHSLTRRHNRIVVWQQYWLLYLPCCYSNKHPSLSPICCAKQSPYQHLAHHAALCQSGPRCQDRQPATEAQTHSSSLRLPHGFLIIPLSLPHQATEGKTEKKRSVNVRCLKIRMSAPTSCPGCENIVFLCSCTFIVNLHNLSSSLMGGVARGNDGGRRRTRRRGRMLLHSSI